MRNEFGDERKGLTHPLASPDTGSARDDSIAEAGRLRSLGAMAIGAVNAYVAQLSDRLGSAMGSES